MIKVSILYPYREQGRLEVDYYRGTHMPLAAERFAGLGSVLISEVNAGA